MKRGLRGLRELEMRQKLEEKLHVTPAAIVPVYIYSTVLCELGLVGTASQFSSGIN